MVGSNESPKLKRKREGIEAQRKKLRKSKLLEGKNETSQVDGDVATPIAKSMSTGKEGMPTASQQIPTKGTVPETPSTSTQDTKLKLNGKDGNTVASTLDAKTEVEGSSTVVIPVQTPGSKKRGKKNKQNTPTAEDTANGDASNALVAKSEVTGKTQKKHENKQKTKPKWSISPPQGGWFLPQDPVFSHDEKYIVLANIRALQIYAADTSLLAIELPVGGSGVLSAYALSSTKPTHIYIADSAGLITLWNWTDGSKLGRWDIGANIRHLEVVTQPGLDQDLVYCHEVGSSHIINVHALRTKAQASKTELKRILKTSTPIFGIQVFAEGRVVVAATANSVLIGKRSKLQKTELQDFEYTWREFKTAKRIATFNAFLREVSQDQRDHLDLAVGDESGVIHLFDDILSAYAAIEKGQKNKDKSQLENLKPSRLHWHRNAVRSVKWSKDGSYLISGGDETVLLIWQLSTGKAQHLPHLTAAIENVVVSPSGASYALSLANNSVIVLSTSELQAKTNIIGIQSRRVDLDQLPRESNSPNYSFGVFKQVPAVVDPQNNNQIITSVPSSQPRQQNLKNPPEPYLQTFDMANHRPISRQALTRNNATDPNMGPEGTRILEPSVKFLQISHDGQWLATVDEWTPPQTDMNYLDEGISEFNEEERTFRREIYLKFWQRDETTGQWNLETRIDAPHFFEDVDACGRVFDLVADPTGQGFATVGEDRCIRIWRPKTRLRDGITVRGADKNNGLVTWSLHRSIEISDKLDDLDSNTHSSDVLTLRNSRLSFSSDGSALVAGISWVSDSDPGVLHIIDVEAGLIRRSITEVDVSELAGVGIVGHHLVVVGASLTVWDMIQDELAYCVTIDTPGIDAFNRTSLVRLATNTNDGTFAVSYPQFERNDLATSRERRHLKKATSKVSIFDANHARALWSSKVSGIVLSLASLKGTQGYVILDSSSSIRLLSPKGAVSQLLTPPPENAAQLTSSRMEVEDEEDDGDDAQDGASKKSALSLDELTESQENDKPVVRPEQLQQIFDVGPSHALPPVKDLFHAVVGLYARKPRPVAGAA